ncbi:hypothetical protein L9F63_017934 [Diploptera punctata]|uniref:Inhibitor of growth protein N-terminal histone-binding domain-containing protein n=1 Tax=Diploptera punctata TaxID=6984 RepID=A0AAD8EFM7_DIPPU|nr:hypothetical protein L9F63_017934 [Diploptera punctata]
MLNQAAVEALYSATYVENYLDCVENLPDELQRHLSRMRELDVTYQAYLKEVEQQQESSRRDGDIGAEKRNLLRIQQTLIAAQEVGDERLQIVQTIQDIIENKARQHVIATKITNYSKDQENTEPNRENHHHHSIGNSSSVGGGGSGGGERQSKRARRTRTEQLSVSMDVSNSTELPPPPETTNTRSGGSSTGNTSTGGGTTGGGSERKKGSTGKKKKRKSRQSQQSQQQQQQQRDETPPHEDELAIDPDEPTYCLCDQISYGEMILCDNDLCPIDQRAICPKCRGDRPNVMKPKAQFLKELERYNKEKEEKS